MQKLLSHIESVWNNYGKGEVFWSVWTADEFLSKNINENSIESFYAAGEGAMLQIKNTLRRCGEWEDINHKKCMEYGCGVGRITIPLAKEFKEVMALDISQGHLELAQKRVDMSGIKNIHFDRVDSLDFFKKLPKYDFIVSFVVLQHNPPPIIAMIIEYFFNMLENGGIVMFQVPVQLQGYSFLIEPYLVELNKIGELEMHMLPQNVILEIAHKNNCYLLEVHNDTWVGNPHLISQTFVFKKQI